MTAPARSFVVPAQRSERAFAVPVDSAAWPQPAMAAGQKSFTNVFELTRRRSAVPGIDSVEFRSWFAPTFARWLQGQFRSSEQVAASFGVRHQTAINWWNASNRASGDTVALVFMAFPHAAAWFLAEWERR